MVNTKSKNNIDGKIKLNIDWVSDIINDDYKKWRKGDYVLIKCQMGTGKTYYVNYSLITHNSDKKFLLISNRTNLKRQIKSSLLKKYKMVVPETLEELDEITVIHNCTITSYQAICESALNRDYEMGECRIEDYDFVIADEIHFIYADSAFNNLTRLAYHELIEKHYPDSIMVFMTATFDEIEESIYECINRIEAAVKPKIHPYSSGFDYSYVNPIYFKDTDDVVNTIKNDSSNDKWLLFVTNYADGRRIQRDLGDISTFIKSGSKDKELTTIIKKGMFNKKVLISTKTLDNGINIDDPLLKNIVIMCWDKISFLQMLGRKRVDIKAADMIDLYIPVRYIKSFRSKVHKLEPKVEERNLFCNDLKGFCRKYDNNLEAISKMEDLFYRDLDSGLWELNPIGSKRLDLDIGFFQDMVDAMEDDKFAFIKKQLEWLGLEHTFLQTNLIENVMLNQEIFDLEEYLDEKVGSVMLRVKDRAELIEKINVRDGNNNRLLKSIKSLNSKLEETKSKYFIKEFSTSRIEEGKKRNFKDAWKILKLTG